VGFRSVLDSLTAAWRAAIRAPKEWIAWIRANPSRVVASLWVAGMCAFLWTGYRRAYRKHLADVAAEAPKLATRPKPPPEVVQMLDVDELNQIRIDRLHELGLAAEGEEHAPDLATVKAAREARQKTAAAEGEKVFGDGDVIVVTKGGIEGWIARNKDKKPDPETLAWLRGEEKKDGIEAYASFVDDGHGNSIAGWLARGDHRKAALDPPPAIDGSAGVGSGSGAATGSATAPGTVATGSASAGTGTAHAPTVDDVTTSAPVAVVDPTQRFDAYAIGVAAISVLDPIVRAHRGPPNAADAEALRVQLAVPQIAVAVRKGRLVIDAPLVALYTDGAATIAGRTLARALAAMADRDFLVATDDPDATMAIAAAMAVAGIPVSRISVGVAPEPGHVAIALIGGKR
jgi:hypothetical protein